MLRRPKIRTAFLTFILVTTLPVLALLCRGHSPSRFDYANLPTWERHAPAPIPSNFHYHLQPADPKMVQLAQDPSLQAIIKTDENRLLGNLDRELQTPAGLATLSRGGDWLSQAASVQSLDARLQRRVRAAALRVMDSQDADGYLGTEPTKRTETDREQVRRRIVTQCHLLQSLLAYYQSTHNPAAIYTAMTSSDWITERLTQDDAAQLDGTIDDLVAPFAKLYGLTGDKKYLEAAERNDNGGVEDGLADCALYEATGVRSYLNRSQENWQVQWDKQRNPDPAWTTELFLLTGLPSYSTALSQQTHSTTWMHQAAYTRTAHGIAISAYRPSRAAIGTLHMTQVEKQPGIVTLSLELPHPATLTLSLLVPRSAAVKSVADGTAKHFTITSAPAHSPTTADQYLAITRRWQTNDSITIVSKPAAVHHPMLAAKPQASANTLPAFP